MDSTMKMMLSHSTITLYDRHSLKEKQTFALILYNDGVLKPD